MPHGHNGLAITSSHHRHFQKATAGSGDLHVARGLAGFHCNRHRLSHPLGDRVGAEHGAKLVGARGHVRQAEGAIRAG